VAAFTFFGLFNKTEIFREGKSNEKRGIPVQETAKKGGGGKTGSHFSPWGKPRGRRGVKKKGGGQEGQM